MSNTPWDFFVQQKIEEYEVKLRELDSRIRHLERQTKRLGGYAYDEVVAN